MKTDPRSNRQSLEKRSRYLCVEWGFCIPAEDTARISESKALDADEFAVAILHAEGMVPEYEKIWRRCIKERFTERFGASLVVRDYSDR